MLTLTSPTHRHFASLSPHGFHRVAYYEWGDPANPRVVVCVHGLTRNGRDFDVLGEALESTHRVLAVDMPGRGISDWLADANDYVFATYLTTLAALIARSGAETVDWVGTSMGGLLGIVLAAQANSPVRRLVVNDAGPVIEAAALARIREYVGGDPTFATYADANAYIRAVSAPFGELDDAQWDHLTTTTVQERPDGSWRLRYDPRIAIPFRDAAAPADLWPIWEAVRCPTLVLRGANSDLLSLETAALMTQRGPRPQVLEFSGVGHAPTLLVPEQFEPVAAFLRAP